MEKCIGYQPKENNNKKESLCDNCANNSYGICCYNCGNLTNV